MHTFLNLTGANMKRFLAAILACLFATVAFAGGPPSASFIFAGPVAEPQPDGTMTVRFKYVLAVHSLNPQRIQVIDAGSGAIIIDDAKPVLRESKLKHPDPSIAVYEWEGRSPPEAITGSEPAWLHDKKDMSVSLELRVHSAEKPPFSLAQPAKYSAAAKQAILSAVEYNRAAANDFKAQLSRAQAGDPEEQTSVGVRYARGRGVAQDDAEAVKWYERAAAQGHVQAKVNLGYMYENGRGVPKDYSRAATLYEEGVASGSADAMRNLGWAYAMGHGVPKDKEKARELWSKCAAMKDSQCEEALFMMQAMPGK
ncbi:tetratricopeptide repeat protein [Solimonas sp. SE-A11]|uniref:tetratricopeptide repeat protein n=1 Tax=Solimonas sp. SE-A11 TaxID=3054954 RepID=UPI00259CACB1|nr:tetratricopeptide repeat protein [Solimonas sp. SE-A11]MDM4769973.1 tetratricopeptide repeat protein [Solimonas sp. SE-A11]